MSKVVRLKWRRIVLWASALAVAGTPALAQDGPDYLPSPPLHQVGFAKFWQLQLTLEPWQNVADVYRVDDAIYVTTNDGYVFAVHAYTGAVRWLWRVTTGGYRVLKPAHLGERVVFVTPAAVLHLDRVIGRPIMKFDLRFPAGSPPICDDYQIYIGGLNQRLYAFSPNYDFENWKAGVFAPVTSQPQIYGERIFVATEGGRVFGLVALTRQLLQMGKTFGSVSADLVVGDEGVYVACQDQSLYLLDLVYLEERWRARLNSPLFEPPVVIGETAYQFTDADGVVAVNTPVVGVEERIRWTLPRGRRALSAEGDEIFVLSRDGFVLAVRETDGEIVEEIPAGGLSIPISTPDELSIYLAGRDGRLFCARPIGVPSVTPDQIRAALARPPKPETAATAPIPEQPPSIVPPVNLEDILTPPRTGPPLGGRSKVTRGWTGQPEGRPPTTAPAPVPAPAPPPEPGRDDPNEP